MATSTKVAPPNSLVLISDPKGGEIPATMKGATIAATASCIAVGCQSDADGVTEFTLGTMHEVDPGDHPVFEGKLSTPNHKVAVRSVTGEIILEASVPQRQTTVRVWVNDPREPDRVIVGVA